jgi:hypothetical protein
MRRLAGKPDVSPLGSPWFQGFPLRPSGPVQGRTRHQKAPDNAGDGRLSAPFLPNQPRPMNSTLNSKWR